MGSLLGVPIAWANELLGVHRPYMGEKVRPFTDKQIELVHHLRRPSGYRDRKCPTCSTNCANLLQQQTATADVLKVISRSTFDLQAVLDAFGSVGGTALRREQGIPRTS